MDKKRNSLEEDIKKNALKFLEISKDKIIIFLDLASGSLHHIKNSNLKNVFIIDHHEISEEIPGEINIINPELNNKEKISASVLTYLFCKELDQSNKEYAKIAILGMIGDSLENKLNE